MTHSNKSEIIVFTEELFEKYPLYTKMKINELPSSLSDIKVININMYCKKCKNVRTFNSLNSFYSPFQNSMSTKYSSINFEEFTKKYNEEIIVRCVYYCAACNDFRRYFLLKIDKDLSNVEKIGQYPPWDISIEKEFKQVLGKYENYYKNGKICESQSYGIGAFSYYRRAIEEIIDYMLDSISELMEGEDKEKYKKALEKVKQTKNTSKKIELVYDLTPPVLNPKEFNSLKTLHDKLSGGIHGKSDEDCLKDAQILRETTLFVIKKILIEPKEKMDFTNKMRKLLSGY